MNNKIKLKIEELKKDESFINTYVDILTSSNKIKSKYKNDSKYKKIISVFEKKV